MAATAKKMAIWLLKPSALVSPSWNSAGYVLAFGAKAMLLPPVSPSTMPRPISKVVSVAIKAGTLRTVTSVPLSRPMKVPSNRHPISASVRPRPRCVGEKMIAKTTPVSP